MGFFKFIKQDNENVRKQEEVSKQWQQQQKQQNVTILQAPVSQHITRQENKTDQTLSENKKTHKDDACDFFNVKIYHIFTHKPVFVERCEHENGQSVEKFTLELSQTELSTFDHLDIFKYENGNYDLLFTGNETKLTAELIDFINYCVGVLGPDFLQKKEISREDIRDMRLGIFSRTWHKQIRIENIYYKFSLTLYDIRPQPSSGE
ncbi:MAG: hypothetical protein LBS88_06305 [Tannerellaceae bacterium]|jgi:hypothetical protein|nr:hypothetical protein [Tannerellaceae bacterium]